MTRAHIEVVLTMSLDDAIALEYALSSAKVLGQENATVSDIRMELSKQLGVAERALLATAAVG